ncbi:MAG: hypothetical protein WC459_04625 [Patescibacteria group bacterium]
MFTFQSKISKKIGLAAITNYFIWTFLLLAAIFFSWIFLFVYRHLYAVIIQEAAIANLKSNLVISKVDRIKFDNIIKKFEQKKLPLSTISFDKLNNPFKSINKQ